MNPSAPHILFTEDDEDTRELVSFVLTRSNCKVTLADTAGQALLLARTNKFDLYMLDNWMPGCSGIDLCKKLREFDATTPILFYSGAAYETDKLEAYTSGAQAYLTKPTDIDELLEAVFRLTSKKEREGVVNSLAKTNSASYIPLQR